MVPRRQQRRAQEVSQEEVVRTGSFQQQPSTGAPTLLRPAWPFKRNDENFSETRRSFVFRINICRPDCDPDDLWPSPSGGPSAMIRVALVEPRSRLTQGTSRDCVLPHAFHFTSSALPAFVWMTKPSGAPVWIIGPRLLSTAIQTLRTSTGRSLQLAFSI